MPPDERDKALLYDMLDAARHLRRMWEGRPLDDLLADRTLQWATDRGFNIIGEAARRISDATKADLAVVNGGGSLAFAISLCMHMMKWTTRGIGA